MKLRNLDKEFSLCENEEEVQGLANNLLINFASGARKNSLRTRTLIGHVDCIWENGEEIYGGAVEKRTIKLKDASFKSIKVRKSKRSLKKGKRFHTFSRKSSAM